MSELERLLIESACLRLVSAYCLAADHDDCEGFLAVFTQDAVWVQPSGNVVEGRDALRAFFLARPQAVTVRHVSTNARVDIVDENHARGISYATVYRSGTEGPVPTPAEALQSLIEYDDDYRRTADGWRIGLRRGKTVFRRV